MTWSRNRNESTDAPKTYYMSEAVTEEGIRAEMHIVFNEILRRRVSEGVPEDGRVLFAVNSVNSFVDVCWVDKQFEQVGEWTYTVWLLELGEACLNHEDGADRFVQMVRFATFDMVYDYYADTYGLDQFETMKCEPDCYFFVPEYHSEPEYIIM